jgi:hypothetical protein
VRRAILTVLVVACGARTGLNAPDRDAGGLDSGISDGLPTITFDAPDIGDAMVLTCAQASEQYGSVGCDWVVPTPSFYEGIAPPCWAMFVANIGPFPVHIAVERGTTSYDVTTFGRIAQAGVDAAAWPLVPAAGLPPGDVAVLFMEQDPSSTNTYHALTCPIAPAVSQQYGTALLGSGSNPSLTGLGTAWHIATDLPVQMFDILPYGGAATFLPSAELLIPTPSWGTNYFGIVPQRGGTADKPAGPQWGQIVANEDGTTVTVFPNVSLPSGSGVAAAPANVATVFSLNAGEYLQWQDANEMSGTIIASNHPVGVFGGLTYNCYADLTSTGGGCDTAHQQVPPISAFGSEYAVPPYTSRIMNAPESIRYRFVGATAGTTLAYDPPVPSAPAAMGVGQVVDFETTSAFVVKSQDNDHPFFVAQVMTGCNVIGTGISTECLGDEEFVNILAPSQFLDHYVFFTDPTYGYTNLVVTRVKGASGFVDVWLDCMTTPLQGWTNIDSAGKYQLTNVWLVMGGVPQGACSNGPQSAHSQSAFGVMVWGLDDYASYAYPAGGNIAPLNAVVVPPAAH